MRTMNAGAMIRSAGLAAAAAPLALALVARLGLGGPPATAGAATQSESPDIVAPASMPVLSEQQERVRLYAQAALAQPFAASPMHRMKSTAPIEPSAPEVRKVESVPATPHFEVTAVVVSSRQSLATINGKLRRIGDEVAPGWRLAQIDKVKGVLMITGDDGRHVEISIRQMVR